MNLKHGEPDFGELSRAVEPCGSGTLRPARDALSER